MQSQLFALIIVASSTQARGDEQQRLEPPPARQVVTMHLMRRGEDHALTLEMSAPAAQAGDDDDQPPAQPVMPINFRTAALAGDNFDRWLFPGELSERARLKHLQDILAAKVAHEARVHKLNDPQRAKLRLAGRGDIKRFFDEVQKRRNHFEIDRKDFGTGLAALRRLDELLPTFREGPFGSGSLFAKTLQKINNDRTPRD